jgi:hypothetical protein
MSYLLINNSTNKTVKVSAHKLTKELLKLVSPAAKPVSTVQKCKAIFASMAGASRQEVLKAAKKAGINLNTASTQFYKWVKAEEGVHT